MEPDSKMLPGSDNLNEPASSPEGEEALDIVATQYAELLWKLYWHKRRTGELPDPREQKKEN